MAFNNSDWLQSLVLGLAVGALSLIGEVLMTHESPALAAEETPPDLEHQPCCIPRIYDGDQGEIFFPY